MSVIDKMFLLSTPNSYVTLTPKAKVLVGGVLKDD